MLNILGDLKVSEVEAISGVPLIVGEVANHKVLYDQEPVRSSKVLGTVPSIGKRAVKQVLNQERV